MPGRLSPGILCATLPLLLLLQACNSHPIQHLEKRTILLAHYDGVLEHRHYIHKGQTIEWRTEDPNTRVSIVFNEPFCEDANHQPSTQPTSVSPGLITCVVAVGDNQPHRFTLTEVDSNNKPVTLPRAHDRPSLRAISLDEDDSDSAHWELVQPGPVSCRGCVFMATP